MDLQKLLSLTRQAVKKYNLIEKDDKIAIGISGGKDSLTLLYALAKLKEFYPEPFDIVAVSVDLGFNMNYKEIENLCNSLSVPYHIVKTQIKEIVFDVRKEKNPCSLCAKLRKGALNNFALSINCNKIAYAHHKDDVISTSFLSLIYEGRFQSLEPKTKLDKTGLTLIRPLFLTEESRIKGFTKKYNLPVLKNECPADGYTKRQYMEDLLKKIEEENPGAKNRIFSILS